jgi:hypothetical protein
LGPAKLLQKQLEVNKDLMINKTQMEDRQKHVKVVKETLSKLFFYLQELKATIEKQKYE